MRVLLPPLNLSVSACVSSSYILCFSPQDGVSLDEVLVLGNGFGQGLAHRESLPGQGDARLEQIPPRQPAMPPVRHLIAADFTGDGDGQPSCHAQRQTERVID